MFGTLNLGNLSPGAYTSTKGVAGPDIDMNFAAGIYSGGTLASLLTNLRSGANATDLLWTDHAGAAYTTYAANVLRLKVGQGIIIEEAATNLLSNPLSPAAQTVTLTTGKHVLWMNGPGKVDLAAGTAVIDAAGTAVNGAFFAFNVTTAGTVDVTPSGGPVLFQLEKDASGEPSSFVVGTRNTDNCQLAGAALALVRATAATVVIDASGIPNVNNVNFLNSNGKNQLSNFANSGGTIRSYDGATAFNASLGFGTTATVPFRVGLKWNASTRSIVGNGGTVVSGSGTAGFSGNVYFGGQYPSNHFVRRPLRRLRIWARELSEAEFSAQTAIGGADTRIAGWGDSLGVFYQQLGALFTPQRVVSGGSYAGKDSTYIKNQMVADESMRSWIVTWLTGRNDGPSWTIATINANDDAMIARVQGGRYLVGTITNSHGEKTGTTAHANITAANAARAARLPGRVVDTRAAIVAAYDLSNPMDVIDHANDVPPYSKRLDIAAGTLTQAISDTDTNFTVSNGSVLGANVVILIDSEYINILAVSGNTVTSCTRGYAGTAAAHANGAAITGKDPTHFNVAGQIVLATAFRDAILAKGW